MKIKLGMNITECMNMEIQYPTFGILEKKTNRLTNYSFIGNSRQVLP